MTEEWYYAADNQQKGPVGPAELLTLEKSGHLNATTLIWKQGQAAWRPWSEMAADVRAGAAAGGVSPDDLAVCAFSGTVLPKSLMVKYGDHYVAADHKDEFVQSLREGRNIEQLPGAGGMEYVGFWWRVLASVIDWAVKIVPTMLFFIPYWYISFNRIFGHGLPAPGKPPPMPLEEFTGPDKAKFIGAYVFGVLGVAGVGLFYDTWMVGKFGGTVGKLALNFRVINADGSRPGYMKAFGRWAAEVLDKAIWFIPFYVGAIIAVVGSLRPGAPEPGAGFVIAMTTSCIWYLAGGFPYYMAGWTKQKKALHDMICGTRVIRKPQ